MKISNKYEIPSVIEISLNLENAVLNVKSFVKFLYVFYSGLYSFITKKIKLTFISLEFDKISILK